MKHNLVLDTDSYKASHHLQYPSGVTSMFSYLESRGGKYDHTVFFGLQYLLKKYFTTPITAEDVNEARDFFAAHGEPFPYDGWMYIVKELGGKLPIRIRAVPEGLVVPTHSVLMTVESTDARVFWIVSWLETMLVRLWYPITVATQSFNIKKLIRRYLDETSDDPTAEISFKLHDFGSRGVSSAESAGIGGAAHLVNFMGSDTVEGIRFANYYYKHQMAAFSIPAAEHSTITSWGKENEAEAYRNMVKQFGKPGSLVACVSDSYDLWNAVDNLWAGVLLNDVKSSGCTLVIRPDSGIPHAVILKILQKLETRLGSEVTTNTKGYKVLPKYFRVIQGDGVNEGSIFNILQVMKENGWSASNIAFGMGGALLQQVNRDTQKFAFKCSSIRIDGRDVDVYKDPVTDPGKKSKKGRLKLIKNADNEFFTVSEDAVPTEGRIELLRTVYENGTLLIEDDLDTIRGRTNV